MIVAGLSGSLAAFGPEIDAALNPEMLRVAGGPVLPLQTLVERFEAAEADWQVISIEPPLRPNGAARVGIAARTSNRPSSLTAYDEAWLDPVTGQVTGMRDTRLFRLDGQHFIPLARRIHLTLLLPGRWGAVTMGTVALAWAFTCLVGFYLTLPSGSRFWARWKNAWLIKRDTTLYRWQFDLHRASGLWLWGILLVLATSGVSFNLPREVFRPAIALFGPLTPPPIDRMAKLQHPVREPRMSWDRSGALALNTLSREAHGWRIRFIAYLPDRGVWRVRIVEPGFRERWFRVREDQVYLRDADQEVVGRIGYGTGTAGDRVLAWQYPLHTGRMFGLPGRILICFTGLAVAALSITGVYIWWNKRTARVRRKGLAGSER